ncbi:hypothetical protein KGA66_29095 [Actinocrinis puniceicyclus]|uniref:Uncharacterized protein n=1 Tax=Actinocrinis puniceicyclus TaxID=977794 RepID=A0A8J7WRJ4_9ACTN|nr:hypothetical protein [Actinocrinis puniceicyclus]MBS2967123.1 hypothetical protein [Actinocrinis puniceicyclus]
MVCQAALRVAVPDRQQPWIRGTSVLAPIGFVLATLILYWAKWQNLRIALPLPAAGVAVYFWNTRTNRHSAAQVRAGLWLVLYVGAIVLLSWLGSFGGRDMLRAPWDSVAVGAIGAAGYTWGVSEAVRFLRTRPRTTEPGSTEPGATEPDATDPGATEPA